jgi:hypothetical protein
VLQITEKIVKAPLLFLLLAPTALQVQTLLLIPNMVPMARGIQRVMVKVTLLHSLNDLGEIFVKKFALCFLILANLSWATENELVPKENNVQKQSVQSSVSWGGLTNFTLGVCKFLAELLLPPGAREGQPMH